MAPSKLRMARSAPLPTINRVRYHPTPIHGKLPERPVFSEACCSPFCSMRTVCLSISLLKGPSMAQSWGTVTDCQRRSLNCSEAFSTASSCEKRHDVSSTSCRCAVAVIATNAARSVIARCFIRKRCLVLIRLAVVHLLTH